MVTRSPETLHRTGVRPPVRWLAAVATALLLSLTSTVAHHGSAEYDVTRTVTVRGVVKTFRWVNPHVRVVLTVTTASGKSEEWDCEGPPLNWAQQQGWTDATLRSGERLVLVMYPVKGQARGGLIRRIEREAGPALEVSRPWLDGAVR
jgi:hypothetical protein